MLQVAREHLRGVKGRARGQVQRSEHRATAVVDARAELADLPGRPLALSARGGRALAEVELDRKMLAELAIPQQQAVYASELGYPGLNLESLNYVDAKVKPYLPTQYLDKQFWISDEWYAENGTKAAELWNAWMLKKA